MMQGWYYVKSLTGQRLDRVQTESQQLQPCTAVSTLLGLVSTVWQAMKYSAGRLISIYSLRWWWPQMKLKSKSWPIGQCHMQNVCVCPQLPYRGNDMIFWIFPIVHCRAFCMWHGANRELTSSYRMAVQKVTRDLQQQAAHWPYAPGLNWEAQEQLGPQNQHEFGLTYYFLALQPTVN